MQSHFEIHGHRGYRGRFPENTLLAFQEAAKLHIEALELDIVISKDSRIVISHEPWFNHKICSEPDGEKVRVRAQHNIYKMDYAEIKKYDCGKRGNADFPEQKSIPSYKPLLNEMIDSMELFCLENQLKPITYNIEIKSSRLGDRRWHPRPEKTASLLLNTLKDYPFAERLLIQSFDVRCLQYIHKLRPDLRIGLLVFNRGSVEHNIRKLGFTPYMYNPQYKLLKQRTVKDAHARGCKVIPWTVNTDVEMKAVLEIGVDGLITDYPDVAAKLR
jgi:glycerophosphoryl diester phosphodiesterase